MAIDGIVIKSIVNELKDKIEGGKIQKIYQLNEHILLLNIYNNRINYQLLISTNPQNARLHFTKEKYDIPSNPPAFCMVLRKYLQNSTIKSINQIGLDRSVEFLIESKDELGFYEEKRLFVDIMGKYSNIVLTNNNHKVIEAIKRISHEMSSVRAVYPGTIFTNLENNKIDILKSDKDLFDIEIPENYKLKKIFYMFFTGFGPQIGNEIAFRSNLDLDLNYGQLNYEQKFKLNESFLEIKKQIIVNNLSAFLYFNKENVDDFYPLLLNHKGNDYKKLESISESLDLYYKYNVNDNSLNQAKNNLDKVIDNLLLKATHKLDNLKNDYNNALDYEKTKIEGDLLSAIAHNIKKGVNEVNTYNYYDDTYINIKLDPKKSIWENIESKYKTSRKAHKRLKLLKISIPNLKNDIEYFHMLKIQLNNIESLIEIDEIKEELSKEGFIKKSNKSKKKKESISKPLRFITKNNNLIYVGKNNKQNEQITLREANQNDLFFHIKDLPGSHVILKSTYNIDEDDIYQAAYLAAKYSKNSNDRYIDVDYTEKKNVNKAKGSKPGMVYYSNFKTIRIDLENIPDNLNLFTEN